MLYQNIKSDREFRVSLLFALISTLVWWYLDRCWAGMIADNDNPYAVLGLTPPVHLDHVQSAYCRLSMVYRDHFNLYQYICRPGTRCPYFSPYYSYPCHANEI
jgi:hypothetical protein